MNTSFLGSDCIDLLSAQGKSAASGWKSHGKVAKIYDGSIKANAFYLTGSTETKLSYTKQSRLSVPTGQHSLLAHPISHRFIILQIFIPSSRVTCIELGFHDHDKNRRRLIISSAFRELSVNSLHAQLPLTDSVTHDQWRNLVFDMNYLVQKTFDPRNDIATCYKSIESIAICGSCRLRRVFTMKYAPEPETNGRLLDIDTEGSNSSTPKQFALSSQLIVPTVNAASDQRIRCASKQTHLVMNEYFRLGASTASKELTDTHCKPNSAPAKEARRNPSKLPHAVARRRLSSAGRSAKNRDPKRKFQDSNNMKVRDRNNDHLSTQNSESRIVKTLANPTPVDQDEIIVSNPRMVQMSSSKASSVQSQHRCEIIEHDDQASISCTERITRESNCQILRDDNDLSCTANQSEKEVIMRSIDQKLNELSSITPQNTCQTKITADQRNIEPQAHESLEDLTRLITETRYSTDRSCNFLPLMEAKLRNHLKLISQDWLDHSSELRFDDAHITIEDSTVMESLKMSEATEPGTTAHISSSISTIDRCSTPIKLTQKGEESSNTGSLPSKSRSGSEFSSKSDEELSIDITLDLENSCVNNESDNQKSRTIELRETNTPKEDLPALVAASPSESSVRKHTLLQGLAEDMRSPDYNQSMHGRLQNLLESTDWSKLDFVKERRFSQAETAPDIPHVGSIELIYDPVLRCYHDPVNGRYYALK